MTAAAVEPGAPALPTGVLGNPPATDVGAAQAFALAIQLALGLPHAVPTVPGAPGNPNEAKAGDQKPGGDQKTGDQKTGPADPSVKTDADTARAVDVALAGLAALVPAPNAVPATVSTAVAATVPTAVPGSTGAVSTGVPPVTAQPVPAATSSVASLPADTKSTGNSQTDPATPKAAPSEAASPPTDAAPATAPSSAPVSTPVPTPQVTSTASVAPVAPPPPTAPTTPTTPYTVSSQVIPEVTRLFSNGEGVHRVTLELNPRALGEVRVVLTVRNGDVHVRLAAGTEAREALAHSAGDLTRALEHIGVKDHRLSLTDLTGVTPSTAPQTQSGTTDPQQQQYASFDGRFDTEQHHDSRQPRMGDGSTATDGTDHDNGTRTRGDRSIHEVSTVPVRGGVDLRM